jgi:hypothetical protein
MSDDIEKVIEKTIATKLNVFIKEQREAAARERLLDRIEKKAQEAGLHEDHLDDVRANFQKRLEAGESLGDQPLASHVASYKATRPHVFKDATNTSPTEKDGKQKGSNDSGTTKLDYARPENDKAFRKLVGGLGVRVA